MKKLLALILCMTLLTSTFSFANVSANEETQTKTTLENNNVNLSSDSGISGLLQNAIEQEQSADEEDIANQILDVSVENQIATVSFNNNVKCKLIVAIYDEATGNMAGSGIKTVEKDAEETDVTLDVDTMPEYFTVKVFILDEDNKPLNKSFESIYYTKAHQEFLEKTTDDFNSENVLNLDSDKTNNFAVFDDDTKQIEETEKNKLESKNDETKTYTFSNIDTEISSLQEGDDFYYEYNDEYIIVKVKTITINGTNATIVGEQDVELDDIFSFVKIDTESNGEGTTVDASDADEGVTYEGVTYEGDSEHQYLNPKQRSSIEIDNSIKQKYKIEKEKKSEDESLKFSLGVSLELKIEASLKAELYLNYFSIEFKISPEFTASIGVKGSIKSSKIHLGSAKIPLGATGLTAGVDIDFLAEFSGEISFKVKQTSALGFGFDTKQGFSNKCEPAKTTSEFNFEGKIFVGIQLSPNVEVLAGTVKVELNGSGGLEIKAENFKKSELDENVERHNCIICLDGSVSFKSELKVTLKLKLLFIKSETEYKLVGIEFKLFDWYFNGKFGKGDCPNSSYKVIFTIRNSKGEKLTGATVNGQKVDENGKLSIFCSPKDNEFEIKCDGYKTQKICYKINPEINKFKVTLKKPTESGDGDITDLGVADESDFEYFVLPNGTAEITKYIGSASKLKIPSKLGEYTVTSIGDDAFKNCTSLTRITIPDSVTSIGSRAFFNCESLASVTIGNSVTSIGDSAFYDCRSLTSITIPDSVTSIGDCAFLWCKSLTSVTIPDGVTSIGGAAFSWCTSLTSVTIGNGVTSIGSDAFYNCSSLTSVTIGNSVTSIGYGAFSSGYYKNEDNWENNVLYIGNYLIDAKTSISGNYTIKEGTKVIADGAFFRCKSLTSVTIPDSVTSIGYEAFSGCESLASITIPNSVTSIGEDAFCNTGYYNNEDNWENNVLYIGNYLIDASYYYYNEDTDEETSFEVSGDYNIKDGTKVIADIAFYWCESLTSVKIPDSVTSIGHSAFYECTSLTSVTIPDSVTSIGGDAFYGCESLTSVTIPNGVTSIGDGAFSGCESLTSVTIPDSVTSIGGDAFYGCESLTSVTIPDSVTSIGGDAFKNCTSLTSVTIPDSVTSIGNSAFSWCTSLTSINVAENNENYCDINGILFNKDKTELIQYPIGKTDTSYSIPNSVTSIGDYAFSGCESLTSVTIPDSVTSIGEDAFSWCKSLTSVTIPDSVTSIGSYAFEDCTSLTSITIPDSVTSIGDYAFYSCRSLTDIYYSGTQEQWNRIYIGSYNSALTSATIHYNSSGAKSKSINSFKAKNYLLNNSEAESDNNEAEYKTLSKTDLAPNQVYVLMIIAGGETDYEVNTSSLKYITDAVADENGNIEFKYLYDGEEDVIAVVFGACNHIAGEWQIEEESSCTADGERVRYCTKCFEALEIQTIPAAHIWDEDYTVDVEPTENTEGSKSIHCSVCGAKKPGSEVILPPTASTESTEPTEPTEPSEPIGPTMPTEPTTNITNPTETTTSNEPIGPTKPSEPLTTTEPVSANPSTDLSTARTEPTTTVTNPTETTTSNEPIGPTKPANTNTTVKAKNTTSVTSAGPTKAVEKSSLKVPGFKLLKGRKQFKIKYKAVSGANGFQVRYKIKGKWKTKTFKAKKNATKLIKKLKRGTYKVQIRSFAKNGSEKLYSKWSKTKKVKVK